MCVCVWGGGHLPWFGPATTLHQSAAVGLSRATFRDTIGPFDHRGQIDTKGPACCTLRHNAIVSKDLLHYLSFSSVQWLHKNRLYKDLGNVGCILWLKESRTPLQDAGFFPLFLFILFLYVILSLICKISTDLPKINQSPIYTKNDNYNYISIHSNIQ